MFYGHEMKEIAVWNNFEGAEYTASLVRKWPLYALALVDTDLGGWTVYVYDVRNPAHGGDLTKGCVQALMARHDIPQGEEVPGLDVLPFFDTLPKEAVYG